MIMSANATIPAPKLLTICEEEALLRLTHEELAGLPEEELLMLVENAQLPMCQNISLSHRDRPTLTRMAHLARRALVNRREQSPC